MNSRTTLITLVMILSLIITSLVAAIPRALGDTPSGRQIDVYTQKTPFDGRGYNQSSDAFQPQETVFLYAYVTYNDVPVANKIAAFEIRGPPNQIQNITIIGSSLTNLSGIAEFSFRIPWPPENPEAQIFGLWYVVATVDIAEQAPVDTLTFLVGWIIKIKNITTLNDQLIPQTSFLRQTTVVFNLTIENIAFTSKTATITIDVQDSANYPIMHIELYGLVFLPGENWTLASALIPGNARIGYTIVSAQPHTALPSNGGVPWSPPTYATFEIVTRDIAIVSLVPSKTVAEIGETINIAMIVKNKGNQTESFDVSTYFNQTLIEEKHVTNLLPSTQTQIMFSWVTTNLPEGDYVIAGLADAVEGEIDVDDNRLADGIIKLYAHLPPITRDVAVTLVDAQPLEAEIGTPIQILARVKNLGSIPEYFNVTLFYDNFPMTIFQVDFLAPGDEQNLTYTWDTTTMMEGNYTIKAYILPLPDEQNTANNLRIDGTVWLRPRLPHVEKHDIAVVAVNASSYDAYVGDTIGITVKLANFGDFAETFNVTVYANTLRIGNSSFVHLNAGSNTTLSFFWSTVGMGAGSYTLWAYADPVPGETNTQNNLYIDGTVTLRTSLPPFVHDIAVISVQPQSQEAFIGERVAIIVIVKNNGSYTETFNVTVYYDSNPIQKTTVYSLSPTNEQTLTFQWDTTNVEEGNYTISAYAEPVLSETNTQNNLYIDGTVKVKRLPSGAIHDVAVVFLSADPMQAEPGEEVTIEIRVFNLGNVPENFNVTACYDSNVIQVIPVTSLAPYTPRTIVIDWNTENVRPGVYTLSASATILEGETNTQNNRLEDGKITIKSPLEIPSWILFILFLILLALMLLLLLLLLILYARRRKKKRPVPTSRYIGLVHPHI